MAPSFEGMFRDYDKELADVERNRVDDVKAAENKWEAQRQGVMQQVAGADSERSMSLQLDYENSFGNEANEIAKINKDADQKKEGIEGERKADEQGRIEATGLESDAGPAPDPGAPANVNAFGVVPPDSPEPPPKEAAKEAEQSQERGTFLQDLAGGAKSFAADALLNLAAIGVALTTQVQSILETVDHESALGALNQEKLAVTRDGSDIKSDAILVKPSVEQGDVDDEQLGTYKHKEMIEKVEAAQDAVNAEKNAPALVQSSPEPRVVTSVNGIDLQPPPHIPPPAANDNESETKTR
jgi:hypothetical protein